MANEKRLIDANELLRRENKAYLTARIHPSASAMVTIIHKALQDLLNDSPTVDAVEVVHGRWILTANEEYSNYRWNVTAECSECHHSKGEIYAGFFPGFPTDLARDVILDSAKSVKLDNYCPNCGAKMDGDGNG